MFASAVLLLMLQAPATGATADRPGATRPVPESYESARRALADERRPLDQRASIALDEAAALDRAAGASPGEEERRSRSDLAVRLLDEFNAAHPRHPLETPLALQAAVFVWAESRREADAWRLAPSEPSRKARAVDRLDDCLRRLDRIEPALSGADPLVAQNARFRLAQALADRAGFDPGGSAPARDRLDRALAALEPIPTEPSLGGHARLLKAEILARIGRPDRAEDEVEAAARSKVPPPARDLAEARSTILVAQRRYRDAIAAIDASGLDPIVRGSLAVGVRLAERRERSAGQDRDAAQADAFARAEALRGSTRPDAKLALNDLAREVDRPTARSAPEAWDLLAEGAIGLGDPPRASTLLGLGADRAAGLGRREDAGRYRFKAGAILFRAGDYPGADALLGRVWDDPDSGPSRPRAGMLRALARGRALAEKAPGASRRAYDDALRDQVRAYPDDPSTSEARWLLGRIEQEEGRPEEAIRQWRAIPPGHPRWLASRAAIADQHRRDLDELRIADDAQAVRAQYREASAFLRESLSAATGDLDAVDLELASAWLDLTPGIGRIELARSLCERLMRRPGTEAVHARARALRVVALAMLDRFAEAEPEARAVGLGSTAEDALLAARLIDREAGESESDVHRARSGRLIRALLDVPLRDIDALTPPQRAEVRLRSIRATAFVAELDAARRALRATHNWDPADLDLDGLRDLADTFVRVEAYGLAVDVERLRARRLRPGSLAWLQSRYVLGLALDRDRKRDDARQVLDATAILHPDLGGGALRDRFERLRRRIEQD